MFRLTPAVKNILIVNVVVFVAQIMFKNIDLTSMLAMYRLDSDFFQPYQILTYMFAHSPSDFTHLLFNMLGLIFLGVSLEMVWGSKRFLAFYLFTGIGAGIFYAAIGLYDTAGLKSDMNDYRMNPSVSSFIELVDQHKNKFNRYTLGNNGTIYEFIEAYENDPETYKSQSVQIVDRFEELMVDKYPGRVVGASGAVYGILMAFGMLFPERQLMLLFPPIPIKAKYLVLILGGIALYSGLKQNPGDPVAHFVHLGGMLFAFIMIKYFK